VTIVVVFMVLLAGEADLVEGVKEDTSELDTLKDKPQLKENALKDVEVAPEKEAAAQGGEGVEASAGEDEKKIKQETSNAKDGGDDDGGNKESADANGGDEGQSGTELENSDGAATSKDHGEATNTKAGDVPLTLTTLDQSNNTTTNLNTTQLTNSSEPGSDATENGMDKTTESYDPNTSTGEDTVVSDVSSSPASSFVPSSSTSSSSPPVDNQEIPPPGKQKPTESNESNQKEDSGSGKVAANDEPKIAKLEESSSGEGKEAASEEAAAKGANPDPVKEAVDSDISKKEDKVIDVKAPEVQEESKVDTPMETSFEKQMNAGADDPPQSNFFSYFIVLAIITIIAYLVFHNKKKILGLIVEGRSGRQAGRRRSGGREYRKLDSNMEDMMETGREPSMRQVIY